MIIDHVVESAIHGNPTPSALPEVEDCAREIERLRSALAISDARVNALIWVLRIVRREVNWGPDSPTLRLVEQSIAGAAEAPRPVEQALAGGPLLRSV